MPNNANDSEPQERYRMTLDLSARQSSALTELAVKRGETKADILRLAMNTLTMADKARDEGFKVGAWGTQGDVCVEREFVGF